MSGDEVTLCADTHNIADGTSATIKIVEKDADGNDDDVATLKATVQNNTIECAWKVVYTADNDDTDSEQEKLDIKDEIEITVSNFEKLKGKTLKLFWKDGSSKSITIASQKLIVKDIFIGSTKIKII